MARFVAVIAAVFEPGGLKGDHQSTESTLSWREKPVNRNVAERQQNPPVAICSLSLLALILASKMKDKAYGLP
jgi:hypothetical protein